MTEVNAITEVIQMIISNVWTLTFALLYVLAYMLKENTSLDNRLISTVMLVAGSLLGFLIIDTALVGAVGGLLLAFAISGSYEWIRDILSFMRFSK